MFNLKSSEDDYTDALFYPKPSDSSMFTHNIERKLKNPYKSNGISIPRFLPPPDSVPNSLHPATLSIYEYLSIYCTLDIRVE